MRQLRRLANALRAGFVAATPDTGWFNEATLVGISVAVPRSLR